MGSSHLRDIIPKMKAVLLLSVVIPRHLARQPSAILPCPQSVLEVTSAAIWDHTLTVGWETSACLRAPSVLPPAAPRLLLSVRMERRCATWEDLLMAAGWEITAWLRAPSVPLCAILLFPRSVARLTSVVTWEHMTDAGWETSVCRRAPSVLPPATPPLRLSARRRR